MRVREREMDYDDADDIFRDDEDDLDAARHPSLVCLCCFACLLAWL